MLLSLGVAATVAFAEQDNELNVILGCPLKS
jgi:hypothetical protein